MGGENKNDRVASPESLPIDLNMFSLRDLLLYLLTGELLFKKYIFFNKTLKTNIFLLSE